MSEPLFVGIDIAATSATVSYRFAASAPCASWTIPQTEAGYAELVARLAALAAPAATRVVLEATGNYWLPLALYLHQQAFIVLVVNPLQPKHFARFRLQRTKTDAVDAQLLADLAQVAELTPWRPPPALLSQLQQRLGARHDLLQQRTQLRNQRHALKVRSDYDPAVAARFDAVLACLQTQLDALTDEIEALLKSEHCFSRAVKRLLTIPGVGIITAAWIVVATEAFARCETPEQAAAFAGLAPHARDSGATLRGRRSVGHGGHKALRDSVYMASLSAARFNPFIRAHYQQLLARGKCKKVAQCAAARKLLTLAWAVVAKDHDFDPNYRTRQLAA